MIDPLLEEQILSTQQLLQFWQRFHDYFTFGVKGTDIDAQRETEFLQIKSQIAMLHDSFMDALTHDRNIGQNIMGILSRCITLKSLKRMSNADVQKMEIEWHESYLLLNETIGTLQEKKSQMADINPIVFKIKKQIKNIQMNLKHFFGHTGVKAAIVVIVVVGLIVGLFAFFIDIKELNKHKYTKPIYTTYIKVAKAVNPNMPYDSTDEVSRDKDWPGEEVVLEDIDNCDAENLMYHLRGFGVEDPEAEIENTLSESRIIVCEVETQDSDDVAPANIYMVFYNDILKASNLYLTISSSYEDYLDQSGNSKQIQLFNDRNVLVIITSDDGSISRQIRQNEFKK